MRLFVGKEDCLVQAYLRFTVGLNLDPKLWSMIHTLNSSIQTSQINCVWLEYRYTCHSCNRSKNFTTLFSLWRCTAARTKHVFGFMWTVIYEYTARDEQGNIIRNRCRFCRDSLFYVVFHIRLCGIVDHLLKLCFDDVYYMVVLYCILSKKCYIVLTEIAISLEQCTLHISDVT